MTVVVLGIDALDYELVDTEDYPNLRLNESKEIDTIISASGEPSTHELWPTIITGLTPEEHGLKLEEGVAWGHPLLRQGSRFARHVLPPDVRTRIGSWLLNQTNQDTFRVEASYYNNQNLETIFDNWEATAIGVPNYVVDPSEDDREHELRRTMGDLFERDQTAKGGHRSSDPEQFFELCMEMIMIRIARVRRALRSRNYELVFGYTSGLDLIGHVGHSMPSMVDVAYNELDDLVGELQRDLNASDDLLLVSDHGLQDGVHTDQAMIASTSPQAIESVYDVTDIRMGIEFALKQRDHSPVGRGFAESSADVSDPKVKEHLEDLGYM